jgi:predicted sulfurtransferase
MYCTGGIRCDVYSTFLQQRGFRNLYSLQGGIQHYLEEVGAEHWKGSLHVFDDRMAVAPGRMGGATAAENEAAAQPLPSAEPCAVCGGPPVLPHINCADVDCNLLFLICGDCKARLKGCCCEACRDHAPRLVRPTRDGARAVISICLQYHRTFLAGDRFARPDAASMLTT